MQLNNILEHTIKTAKAAGEIIMKYYNKDYDVKDKSAGQPGEKEFNPVTIADLESNKIIIADLEIFGYEVLSEEKEDSDKRLDKDRVWIIDPLDGTSDFIDKTGEFSVMIGLVENGLPILGVVYNPPTDTVYYATHGEGAFSQTGDLKPQKLSVSICRDNGDVRMLVSRFHLGDREIKLFDALKFREKATCGSAGLKIARIAAGEAELNMNTSGKTKEWDICAADIILREAGGKLTDMNGDTFVYNKPDVSNRFGYVASNKIIHGRIMEEL